MLRETEMNGGNLLKAIEVLHSSSDEIITAQRKSGIVQARARVVDILTAVAQGTITRT
jgi:hypothetical protein